MLLMVGLACLHGIRVPRRRSLPGSSGLAPTRMRSTRAASLRCTVPCAIAAAAVRALIEGGADPRVPNRNGSTPLLLATQNTGRGGSGSAEAKAQQKEILRLLVEHGAT